MLVQSHTGLIDLLPALPSELPTGEINGICARGGFDLNLKWRDGKLQAVEVLSKAGSPCQLRYGDKTIRIKTTKGKRYKLDANLKLI
jgi:alpha-L-fucosidase 2